MGSAFPPTAHLGSLQCENDWNNVFHSQIISARCTVRIPDINPKCHNLSASRPLYSVINSMTWELGWIECFEVSNIKLKENDKTISFTPHIIVSHIQTLVDM